MLMIHTQQQTAMLMPMQSNARKTMQSLKRQIKQEKKKSKDKTNMHYNPIIQIFI